MFAAADAQTPVDVLGAQRLVVEVPRAVVVGPPPGGRSRAGRPVEKALSRSPWPNTRSWSYLMPALAVEVDVEELARPQRLRDAGGEVEPGHLLVPDLGVQPDHVARARARR